MADATTQYQDIVLDTLKSKTSLATDSSGKIVEGTSQIANANPIYLGDSATDGTWKIEVSGGDLIFSKRESGSYVAKGTVAA